MQDLAATGDPTYHYSVDERSSVLALTDSTAAATNTYAYNAFGETYSTGTSVTVEQRYQYTGRERNPKSGTDYFRYRTYSPLQAAFSSRDPLGYVDGTSLYAGYFARSLGLDPFGLSSVYVDAQCSDGSNGAFIIDKSCECYFDDRSTSNLEDAFCTVKTKLGRLVQQMKTLYRGIRRGNADRTSPLDQQLARWFKGAFIVTTPRTNQAEPFAHLTKNEFGAVLGVLQSTAMAFSKPLTIKCDTCDARAQTISGSQDRTITLCTNSDQFQGMLNDATDLREVLFHELTHNLAKTGDYRYYTPDPGLWRTHPYGANRYYTSVVHGDVGQDDVGEFGVIEAIDNADTYAGFLESFIRILDR